MLHSGKCLRVKCCSLFKINGTICKGFPIEIKDTELATRLKQVQEKVKLKKTEAKHASTIKKREKVYKRGDGICYICDKPVSFEEFTIDHVIPKSKGGPDKLHNMMPTHAKCNNAKGNKIFDNEYSSSNNTRSTQ